MMLLLNAEIKQTDSMSVLLQTGMNMITFMQRSRAPPFLFGPTAGPSLLYYFGIFLLLIEKI